MWDEAHIIDVEVAEARQSRWVGCWRIQILHAQPVLRVPHRLPQLTCTRGYTHGLQETAKPEGMAYEGLEAEDMGCGFSYLRVGYFSHLLADRLAKHH